MKFRGALLNACDKEARDPLLEEEIKLRKLFNEEYPISRLREMELDEYVAGKESEDSFCYKIEFGKYKLAGIGIGGAAATKFGIYYSKKGQEYRIRDRGPKTRSVDNPEEYWKDFRNELCNYLEECGTPGFNFDYNITERYPKLNGMGMVLNKLCFLYYPNLFVNASHKSSVFTLKRLGVDNYGQYDRVQMPFIVMRTLHAKIPELFAKNYDTQVIGNAIWTLVKEETSLAPDDKTTGRSSDDEGNEVVCGGENVIFYGNPGCGKSYLVKKRYETSDFQSYHTVFHPDYTNSDFVGQVMPSVSEGNIRYVSVPGPFTKALSYALSHPAEKVSLIIDEINRGNAAAILGDILQLLDRDSDGNCEYEINNDFIETYCDISKVSIPSNMWIIATMNTSDQNVFPLDTAFKRRWKMKRIKNDFNNSDYSKALGEMFVPGTDYKWSDFVKKVNDEIATTDTFGLNAEDKQLGVYFLKKSELSENPNDDNEKKINDFGEKILMYLWEDVAKMNRGSWFSDEYNTLDKLLSGFKKEGLKIIKRCFEEDGKNS